MLPLNERYIEVQERATFLCRRILSDYEHVIEYWYDVDHGIAWSVVMKIRRHGVNKVIGLYGRYVGKIKDLRPYDNKRPAI